MGRCIDMGKVSRFYGMQIHTYMFVRELKKEGKIIIVACKNAVRMSELLKRQFKINKK